jgi:hypothetical protein
MVVESMSFGDVGACPSVLSCLKWKDDERICLNLFTALHRE